MDCYRPKAIAVLLKILHAQHILIMVGKLWHDDWPRTTLSGNIVHELTQCGSGPSTTGAGVFIVLQEQSVFFLHSVFCCYSLQVATIQHHYLIPFCICTIRYLDVCAILDSIEMTRLI